MGELLRTHFVLEPEEDVPEGEKRLFIRNTKNNNKQWSIRRCLFFVEVLAPILHYMDYNLKSLKEYGSVVATEMNDRFDTDFFNDVSCVSHFSKLKVEAATFNRLISSGDAEYYTESGLLHMDDGIFTEYMSGSKDLMEHQVRAALLKNNMDVYNYMQLLNRGRDMTDTERQQLDAEYEPFYTRWVPRGFFSNRKSALVPTMTMRTTTSTPNEDCTGNSLALQVVRKTKFTEEPAEDDTLTQVVYAERRQSAIEGFVRLYKRGLLSLHETTMLARSARTWNFVEDSLNFKNAPDELLASILSDC